MEHAFLPLRRAWARVELDLLDSEASAFYSLLYLGELVVKLTAVAFASGIGEDPDRRSYAAEFRLVRGSGVGEHAAVLGEILAGPTYEVLHPALHPLQKVVTEKCKDDSWQFRAMSSLSEALVLLGVEASAIASPTSLRSWFTNFALLRNKTRGHGAHRIEAIISVYPRLRESLELITSEFGLFKLPWAYIRRNLSGKYRVTPFCGDVNHEVWSRLRSSAEHNLLDGVCFSAADAHFQVKLCLSDADLSDFYVPNGNYNNGHCEFISLITGNSKDVDASKYNAPGTALPGSETDGGDELDVVGSVFTNIPPPPSDYVSRLPLEDKLRDTLINDRHEVISLAGPGGTGKTSLALEACHKLAKGGSDRFKTIIWFSARDIDLLPSGPKTVKPQGLALKDFAKTYANLMSPAEKSQKGFRAEDYLAKELGDGSVGASLFVFDNFETVGSQAELFEWIDNHVRSPNKILITTRTREFSGDKPITVKGLTDGEARELIEKTSARFGIDYLKSANIEELIRESGGHPYVLRILLGEIASNKSYVTPERVIADEERLLGALFERTFSRLSPVAQLLFLILSSWKSAVPVIALEATLLLHAPERVEVSDAVDELTRLSLVEEISAGDDKARYLNVPLAASAFGRKKLATSSHRALIELCVSTLRLFGATQVSGANGALDHSLGRFINAAQRKIEGGQLTLEEIKPVLDFLASAAPTLWLSLERLVAQISPEDYKLRAEYLKRYLEAFPSASDAVGAWRALAYLLGRLSDTEGEILAYGEIARLPDSTLQDVSEAANRLNTALKIKPSEGANLSGFAKRETIARVISRLQADYDTLSATDLSRLAWLHLNIGNEVDAQRTAAEGGRRDPDNEYCNRLLDRLQ